MDVTQILAILFGAIGVLGGVTVFFNGSRKDSIIAVLTKENLTLKDYTSTLEGRATRAEAERDGYKRQYEDARELAQGSPQLKVMAEAMNKQNKLLDKYFKRALK